MRFLVVDDDDTLRLTVRSILSGRGYTVDEAEDGRVVGGCVGVHGGTVGKGRGRAAARDVSTCSVRSGMGMSSGSVGAGFGPPGRYPGDPSNLLTRSRTRRPRSSRSSRVLYGDQAPRAEYRTPPPSSRRQTVPQQGRRLGCRCQLRPSRPPRTDPGRSGCRASARATRRRAPWPRRSIRSRR